MEVLIPARGLLLVAAAKELRSRGGVITPQFDRKVETMRGTVLRIGEPKEQASVEVKVGDTILFCPSASIQVMHDQQTFYFVGQEDVVALVQDNTASNGKLCSTDASGVGLFVTGAA